MEQLELPLRFKSNTYESYTDIQKKEYWHTNYVIQTHRIERAEQRLKKLLSKDYLTNHRMELPDDVRDAIRDILKGLVEEI